MRLEAGLKAYQLALAASLSSSHISSQTQQPPPAPAPLQELILFSRADLERSIPNMVDGLKPGQRKILFACFKRNLKSDVKVAQLAGYVSEHSGKPVVWRLTTGSWWLAAERIKCLLASWALLCLLQQRL